MSRLADKWVFLRNNPAFKKHPLITLFRLVLWKIRCWLNVPATVEMPGYGIRVRVPAEWKGIAKLIFVFRENYEAELSLMSRLVYPGDVALDVGANLGIYSLILSRLVTPMGQVMAFEPSRSAFSLLERNVQINRAQNISLQRAALGNHDGKASLYQYRDSGRNSLGDGGGTIGEEEVSVEKMDTVLRREGIERLDFVKLDVEGGEELVLRGGESAIAKWRPTILFEVNPGAAKSIGLSWSGAGEWLGHHGYQFFCCMDDGSLMPQPTLPHSGNVIAVHYDCIEELLRSCNPPQQPDQVESEGSTI